MKLVILSHLAATLVMVGVIWVVQIVHYPLFSGVGVEGFAAYEARHTRLITWVVGPPMLIEAATAALLLWRRPADIPAWAVWGGAALLAAIWISTATLQVPRHTRLGLGFDAAAHRALVLSNWLRTVLWTARGALVLWMAGRLITLGVR